MPQSHSFTGVVFIYGIFFAKRFFNMRKNKQQMSATIRTYPEPYHRYHSHGGRHGTLGVATMAV